MQIHFRRGNLKLVSLKTQNGCKFGRSKQSLRRKSPFYILQIFRLLNNTHLDFFDIEQKKIIQKQAFPIGFLKYLMYPCKHEMTAP